MIPISILDLSPICEGSDAAQSFKTSLALAQTGERLGFQRYWLAEHHGMPGIASAATAVLLAYIGTGTHTIRIGSGGVMLPNHSPLVIAEQFGTLEALFPGRVDLGLGRAPGTDQRTAMALRRDSAQSAERFPQDVLELIDLMSAEPQQQHIRAVPGRGSQVPVWILGSSTFGAQLAAHLGLPYAFASHFAPQELMSAIRIYRETFRPSKQLSKPHVMLGFNVFAADSEQEANLIASSWQQAFVNLRSGRPGKLPEPVPNYLEQTGPGERSLIESVLSCSAIGTEALIRAQVNQFIKRTGADELMIASSIFDPGARMKSYEILAAALRRTETKLTPQSA